MSGLPWRCWSERLRARTAKRRDDYRLPYSYRLLLIQVAGAMSRIPGVEVAIGYIRLSPGERKSAKNGSNRDALGPEAQRASIERWAAENGVKLIWATPDIDVSGGKGHDERPGFAEAIMRLKRGEAQAIVVARRDRFMRASALTTAFAEAEVASAGGRIISADGVGNGDSPEDVLIRRIVDALSEYKRLRGKEDTKAALAVKKARGERVGQIPYGFRLGADGKTLEPDTLEQGVIAQIRASRAKGLSQQRIAEILNEAKTPARGKAWYPTTIGRLLRI